MPNGLWYRVSSGARIACGVKILTFHHSATRNQGGPGAWKHIVGALSARNDPGGANQIWNIPVCDMDAIHSGRGHSYKDIIDSATDELWQNHWPFKNWVFELLHTHTHDADRSPDASRDLLQSQCTMSVRPYLEVAVPCSSGARGRSLEETMQRPGPTVPARRQEHPMGAERRPDVRVHGSAAGAEGPHRPSDVF
jgi:hypothetical protein